MVKLSLINICMFNLLSLFLIRISLEDENCELKECKEISSSLIEKNMICEIGKLNYNKSNCNRNTSETIAGQNLNIIIKSNKHHILDNTSIDSLMNYVESRTRYNKTNLYFISLKGLNIESTIDFNVYNGNLSVKLHPITDFYNEENKLLKTCDDFEKIKKKNFFIKTNANDFMFYFFMDNNKKITEICELLFLNAEVTTLYFHFLTNSYFKTRLIRFENQSKIADLNSNINKFELNECDNIHLNRDIINEKIFNNTVSFTLFCDFQSIEDGLFQNFKMLMFIFIKPTQFLKICRRQGIKWIQNINSRVNVNLSNQNEITTNVDYYKIICFSSEGDVLLDPNFQFTYDEDFCLFKDFPFNQLIIIVFIEKQIKNNSCTTLWLLKFNNLINFKLPDEIIRISREEIEKCDFEKRLERCNKSDFELHPSKSDFTQFDFMILSEFIIIISSPIMSLFGIITNMIIILVIVKKENWREFKEKQYTYMAVHSVSNIFICLINILNLINECQLPLGFYCSSIRHNVAVQYFKIIFGEYFNCFFRLFSNFTYVAFALNRLSLIGKNHNIITKLVKDVGVKKYIVISILISACFPVVKAFRYIINETYYFKDTPRMYFKGQDGSWYYNTEPILIMIFNAIHDFVNYVFFVLLNLVIDLILVKKLKIVLKEREEKFKEQSEQVKETLKKENDESMRRVINMVVISSLLNLSLKLPIVITSLNDLRILISSQYRSFSISTTFAYQFSENYETSNSFKFQNSMNYLCFLNKICEIFESFGNFLFLISLSVNFFFLKKFDKRFQSAYISFRGKKSNVIV